jgi:hypothetical protein
MLSSPFGWEVPASSRAKGHDPPSTSFNGFSAEMECLHGGKDRQDMRANMVDDAVALH